MKPTLETYLSEHAEQRPDCLAVVCGGESLTYAQLYHRVRSRARQLHEDGLREGQIFPFRTSQSIDFLLTYFAVHLLGAAAAPLECGLSDERFAAVSSWLKGCPVASDTADVLYTTGTTGDAKGVMISHRAIVADGENLIASQGFCPDVAFVIAGPLNHIGSLSKIFPVVMTGSTLIILQGMKNLDDFFAAFQLPFSRFATFLVPANLRILLQFAADRLQALADRLDFIETGAAPMAEADMRALCDLLPHTRLYNTYASTETGIIATHCYSHDGCVAGCLGRSMPHSRLFITPEGTIACQGDTLMSGYVDNPVRTSEVLRDGTLYTSDVGRIDSEGRLHLQGRDDDVINVGGFKVSPVEVEDAALSHPMVHDCICTAVPHPVTGQALRLLVVLSEGHELRKRDLARHLLSRLEPYKVPQLYEPVAQVERTFNGKLNRKHYKS
ncbi:MAG: acyl--CoA ligase [Bacteroidaceae bacterium]|nr:acyl--CoA ligase [Bacteroidaceae bacterium]